MSRKEYKFSRAIKDIAHLRARQNGLKGEETRVEIHHRIPIKQGRQAGVSPDLIRSGWNARGLRKNEHRQMDHEHLDVEDLIQEALEMQPRLFD